MSIHIDLERSQNPSFMWISAFNSVFENLRAAFWDVGVDQCEKFLKNGGLSLRFAI